jgi:hypothetical protein
MEINSTVKKYYEVDNIINTYLEKIKTLRSEKSELHDKITEYTEENELGNSTINIGDDISFKIVTTKSQSPLTFKYLSQSLTTIIGDTDKVDIIVKFIKQNRSVTENKAIKRLSS